MFDKQQLSHALVGWYNSSKRDLPWRRTRDPYAIFLSEVMLQQTQVATVLPYYERFLKRFPTVEALAEAPEEEVLALWAGLGYYRRARLLHAAAKAVVAEHGGSFPRSYEALLALPGIGRYCAGAIGSFALGLRLAIVEANSARVLARLFALRLPIKSAEAARELWRRAEELLPETQVREHNYALMELGSLVCTPPRPRCELCPVASMCLAFSQGSQQEIPPSEPRKAVVRKSFAGAVVEYEGRFLVRKVQAGEWHAGLYEFPKVEVSLGAKAREQAEALSAMLAPYSKSQGFEEYAMLSYTVTHHAVALNVWRAQGVRSMQEPAKESGFVWLTLDELSRLGLSSAQKKLLRLLENDFLYEAQKR